MNREKLGTCPTCEYSGVFTLLGEQHWPPAVAEKLGLPTTILLWRCPSCQTTVSDPDLLPYEPIAIDLSIEDISATVAS